MEVVSEIGWSVGIADVRMYGIISNGVASVGGARLRMSIKRRKCPFCGGYLYLDSNACCITCLQPLHKIYRRETCKTEQEYNIKEWIQQRFIYFGWEHWWLRKFKEDQRKEKIKKRMNTLRKRLDEWYRLHKQKKLQTIKLKGNVWQCDVCKRKVSTFPYGLDFIFKSLPRTKLWINSCILLCYSCKRYVERLIRETQIIKLLEILLKSEKKKLDKNEKKILC